LATMLFGVSTILRAYQQRMFSLSRPEGPLHNYLRCMTRSFENFTAPRGERVLLPEQTLQLPGEVLDASPYASVRRVIILIGWHFVVMVGLVAIVVSWWVRAAPELYRRHGDSSSFFEDGVVHSNLGACRKVQEIILPLASLMLGVHVYQHLEWFRDTASRARSLQFRLCEVAMQVRSALPGQDDEDIVKARWMLYRYLNVLNFYAFVAGCQGRCGCTAEDRFAEGLRKAGLLHELEAEELGSNSAHAADPANTIQLWLCHLIAEVIRAQVVQAEFAEPLVQAAVALRGASSALSSEMRREVPAFFSHMLRLMVDVTVFLTPPTLAHALAQTRLNEPSREGESISAYLWPCLGSIAVASFFHGGLCLARSSTDPLRQGICAVDPEQILVGTERELFGLLADGRLSTVTASVACGGSSRRGEDSQAPSYFGESSEPTEDGISVRELLQPGAPMAVMGISDSPWHPLASRLAVEAEEHASDCGSWRLGSEDHGACSSHPLATRRNSHASAGSSWRHGSDDHGSWRLGSLLGSQDRFSSVPNGISQGEAQEVLGLLQTWAELPGTMSLSAATLERLSQVSQRQTEQLRQLLSFPVQGILQAHQTTGMAWSDQGLLVKDLLRRLDEEAKAAVQLRAQLEELRVRQRTSATHLAATALGATPAVSGRKGTQLDGIRRRSREMNVAQNQPLAPTPVMSRSPSGSSTRSDPPMAPGGQSGLANRARVHKRPPASAPLRGQHGLPAQSWAAATMTDHEAVGRKAQGANQPHLVQTPPAQAASVAFKDGAEESEGSVIQSQTNSMSSSTLPDQRPLSQKQRGLTVDGALK